MPGPRPCPTVVVVMLCACAVAAGARAPAGGRGAPVLPARFCAAWHGARDKGDGPNAKFLPVPPAVHADSAAMSARSNDRLYGAISGGGAVLGRSDRMPAFSLTLTRAEIRALVRYIRALCRCLGPAWSRDDRADLR